MSAPPDYYRILHVQPDAPASVIHAIYRTLLQRLQTSATFAGEADAGLIEEAYGVLGNAQRRAAYDTRRRAAANAQAASPREMHVVAEDTDTSSSTCACSAMHHMACSGGSSATMSAAAAAAHCAPPNGTGSNTRASAC